MTDEKEKLLGSGDIAKLKKDHGKGAIVCRLGQPDILVARQRDSQRMPLD